MSVVEPVEVSPSAANSLHLSALICSDAVLPYVLDCTKARINLFKLNDMIDLRPAISSVCQRRSLGLLNPYLLLFNVPMLPSVLPRSLRTCCRTSSATCQGRCPLGCMPICFTPS